MEGYLHVYRKILTWEWYRDVNTKTVFLHLLFTAMYRDVKYRGKVIPRGCVDYSIRELASAVNLTEMEVRVAIKHLESTGEVEKTATNQTTRYRVLNFNEYQPFTQTKQQTHNERITKEQRTINEPYIEEKGNKVKRKKEIEKNILTDIPKEFLLENVDLPEAVKKKLREWLVYKTERRQAYKPQGMKSLVAVVKKNVDTHGEEKVCEVIDLSMANAWQGIIWDRLKPVEKNTKKLTTQQQEDIAEYERWNHEKVFGKQGEGI